MNSRGTVTLIDASAGATTVGDVVVFYPIDHPGEHIFSIQTVYGLNTGTWKVEASNDVRANPASGSYASADWADVTTTFELTDPAGAAGGELIAYAYKCYALRFTYTKSSGTGAVRLDIHR